MAKMTPEEYDELLVTLSNQIESLTDLTRMIRENRDVVTKLKSMDAPFELKYKESLDDRYFTLKETIALLEKEQKRLWLETIMQDYE